MRGIRSGRWLDVATTGTGKYAIQESACLQYLIDALPNPAAQHPRLWVFLGSNQKNRYLHGIFPQNSFLRTDSGTIRLRGDVTSSTSDSPVLFVDGDPWNASAVRDSSRPKGLSEYSLDWVAETASDVTHSLYSRVLFQFADIVCAFVEDLPIGTDFITLLASHASVPLKARPHLIVVVDGSDSCPSWSSTLDSAQILETFSTVSVFPIEAAQSGTYDRLRALLETHSQEVQTQRRGVIGQLSAFQLRNFLRSAITRLAKTRNYALDFVRVSRSPDDIPPDTGRAINEVLQKCVDVGLNDQDSARFIASALIMDHYGPDMPLMDPKLVFQTLYRPTILASDPSNSSAPLVDSIEREMVAEFARLSVFTSLDLRKQLMGVKNGHYSAIKSNRLCLYCLIQVAQHFTPCDHPMCDLCAQRFGVAALDAEYRFTVDQCLLCCTTVSMVIDVLPPTMDPSVLAIDGGGVRGVIPLEFLILIQEYLGTTIRIEDMFDLDINTSTGGLIGFGVRVLRLTVKQCVEIFTHLAWCIFQETRPPAFPWLRASVFGRIRQWYSWWRHDSCYDGSVFDLILKQLYGERPLYRNHAIAGTVKSGAKFGVVATSIGAMTETVILGNFNAATNCEGFRIIRPSRIQDEPLVWQAARATAAAPFIFPPIDLAVGTFQDGGLTDNFAGGIARRISRTIWPSSREPAILLSLGTGSPPLSTDDGLPHFRHSILDGFIRRVFNAWMTSLEGERKWREMKSQLDDSIAGNFRRLNVPLEETSAALDDVTMMDHYRNLVVRCPGSARDAKDATVGLITARFFFELDSAPSFNRSPFWCHGTIRCKGPARSLLTALQHLVPDSLEFVTDSHCLGPVRVDRDVCPSCNRFYWPVSLRCHDAAQTIHIYIKSGRHAVRKRQKSWKRRRTILKKLWEIYKMCNIKFFCLLVDGIAATVVNSEDYPLPIEQVLGDGFSIKWLQLSDLQEAFGRTTTDTHSSIEAENDLQEDTDTHSSVEEENDLQEDTDTDGSIEADNDLQEDTDMDGSVEEENNLQEDTGTDGSVEEENDIWDIVVPEPLT